MDKRSPSVKPLYSEAQLYAFARSALSLWGGNFSDLKLIKYRENAVFSVRRADRSRVALRIHRHGYHSEGAVRSELSWMQAIGAEDIRVPSVIPMMSGAISAMFDNDALPEPRLVDMIEWLDGDPVSAVTERANDLAVLLAVAHDAGALAARLHCHAAKWRPPLFFERPRWDADGLVGDSPLWGRFWDLPALSDDQKSLILSARAVAGGDLADVGETHDNFGLVHADLIPDNLLKHGQDLRPIDFDDCGYGWYMFDIATILFAYLDEPGYQQIEDALFAGYRSVDGRIALDRTTLPLFMMLRSFTYLGWIQTRSDTEISQSLAPMLIERACRLAARYLRGTPKAGLQTNCD